MGVELSEEGRTAGCVAGGIYCCDSEGVPLECEVNSEEAAKGVVANAVYVCPREGVGEKDGDSA